MKKIIKLSLVLGFFTSISFASPLFISAGAGIWQEKISGYVKTGNTINYFNNSSAETDGNSNTGNLGLSDKNNPYVWINIKTLIPIIPNIKFQYTKYDTTGHSNYIAGNTEIWGDVSINTALTNADTSQTINSFDLLLYYSFNPVVANINLGLGIDYWKGETKIHGFEQNTGQEYNIDEKWNVPLPYLYGEFETLSILNTSLYGKVKWAKAGDNHHYDYEAGIKYIFDIPGPINPELKVGYRYKEAYGVDGDNETELKYKGFYGELAISF